MNGFESNGPGLQYKVSWRQKDGDDEWTSVVVANVSKYIVSGTPTFVPYLIKVQALNDAGFAPEPAVVMGHSGEDRKYLMLFCVYFFPQQNRLPRCKSRPCPEVFRLGRREAAIILLNTSAFKQPTYVENRFRMLKVITFKKDMLFSQSQMNRYQKRKITLLLDNSWNRIGACVKSKL